MAKEESLRTMEIRSRNYDQINVLMPKGYKTILKIMAKAKKTTVADIVRKSIISSAGLKHIPTKEMIDKLISKVSEEVTPREARAILKYLQEKQNKREVK